MAPTQSKLDGRSDTQILELAGTMGPGIIGQELFDRANEIRKRTSDGLLGPALTDPDYHEKQEAGKRAKAKADRRAADQAAAMEQALLEGRLPEVDRRAAGEGEESESELDDVDGDREPHEEPPANDPVDPWSFVTLSGAKMLAQTKGVSYNVKIKRAALIELLQAAGVAPPAPPARPATVDDVED